MSLSQIDPLLIEVPECLEGERILLTMPRAGDGLALNAAVCESLDELRPWMPWAQERPTVAQSEAHVRRMHGRFILREDLCYSIWSRRADGGRDQLLGGTGLHRFDWGLRRFEIGYWIRRSAQGRGHVREAVGLLTRLAFGPLRAQRVEIRMEAGNARSRAVAEACGFALEGVLRHAVPGVDGAPRDACVYARVSG